METDYQFPQSVPGRPSADVVLPLLHWWNGTDFHLVSDHNRPFQVLEANLRITCLDYLTHHHSHPDRLGYDLLCLTTATFLDSSTL